MRHLRDVRGFTLLELLVAMVVAGLLLALALPRFAAARDSRSVHGAVDVLASGFSLARASALAHRAPVAVVFDTAAGVMRVRSTEGPIRQSDLFASFGVTLAANRDSAVYDPRGIGYGLSNLTVVVRRGKFIDTLTMSRMGRVRW
ncbi:MAG TPA: GspH/FimT family pseudopilin [Gemmatimonadaceae bacterium]|jgi:prepilin-type N-terminal cleavage/methylation domain-containing protein